MGQRGAERIQYRVCLVQIQVDGVDLSGLAAYVELKREMAGEHHARHQIEPELAIDAVLAANLIIGTWVAGKWSLPVRV